MNQYINPTFGRYQRPQTEMFMDHTYAQIHNYHLNQCHIQSYIQRIEKIKNGVLQQVIILSFKLIVLF